MCGLAGFLNPENLMQGWSSTLLSMGEALSHRGPDDHGVWFDTEAGCGITHRRLTVLDLSRKGRQPMISTSGRYIVAFNGEIYNFKELRKELSSTQEPYPFQSQTDTEVLLASVEHWGIHEAVKRFIGMFAFALWDRDKRMLHLARDRLGIKPLYYGWNGSTFLFGSELKAFHAYPGFQPDINRQAIALFMRHNYIPAPYSIYEGIRKLTPGTILSQPVLKAHPLPQPVPFWILREYYENGLANPFTGSEHEAVDQLESMILDAVKMRRIADVPLGAFLSGGIDSSTVVAFLQSLSNDPVKTFSIGFHEKDFNEAVYSAGVAHQLGCDHTELYVSARQAMEVVPELSEIYDEPFADPSQIPTYLVSQLTRKSVTVSLSGDGGDELFGGYNRYFMARSILSTIGRLPHSLRKVLSVCTSQVPSSFWNAVLAPFTAVLPPRWKQARPSYMFHKLSEVLPFQNKEMLYRSMISYWDDLPSLVKGSENPVFPSPEDDSWRQNPDFTHWMLYQDTLTSLPDDILTKLDRASMAVGLEARVPLLDHRIVEFACQIPLSMKIKNNTGKWILKEVLYRHLPREMVDRPKMGFSVPVGSWLRGPLRDWAEALLDESRLVQEGFLNPEPIRKKWSEHLSGKCNWQYHLWNILMFQSWYEKENHK